MKVDAGVGASGLDLLSRRWFWVAIPALVLPMVYLFWSAQQPPTFQATATVVLADSAAQRALDPATNDRIESRDVSNELNFATGNRVAEAAEANAGHQPDVEVEASPSSDALTFTATADTPEQAASDANVWADAFIELRRAEASESFAQVRDGLASRLDDLTNAKADAQRPLFEIDIQVAKAEAQLRSAQAADINGIAGQSVLVAQAELDRLEAEREQVAAGVAPEVDVINARVAATADALADLDTSDQLSDASARISQRAEAWLAEASGGLASGTVMTAMLGFAVGVGLASVREVLDDSIRGSRVLTDRGYRVLAVVPRERDPRVREALDTAVVRDPRSPAAVGYQRLRTSVQFAMKSAGAQAVMVTSPQASEGKTTTACNLALAIALAGQDVLLVDTDVHKSRATDVFSADRSALQQLVDHEAKPSEVSVVSKLAKRLSVIGSGQGTRDAELTGTRAFQERIAKLSRADQIVVADAPPVLPTSDALAVARSIEYVVVVIRDRATTWSDLNKTEQQLNQIGSTVLGIVLTDSRDRADAYTYYS